MAHIQGIAGQNAVNMQHGRFKRIFRQLLFAVTALLLLVPAWYFAWGHTKFWLGLVVLFGYYSVLFLIEKSAAKGSALEQAEKAIAEALLELPDTYHVFHGMVFKNLQIAHVVVGPNGIFFIEPNGSRGRISAVGAVLKRNKMPFVTDLIQQCWTRMYEIRDYLHMNGASGAYLTPIICFGNGTVAINELIKGVAVVDVSSLVRFILRQDRSVNEHTQKMSCQVLGGGISKACYYTGARTEGGIEMPVFRICPKCQYERTASDDAYCSSDECPQCGAYYENALKSTSEEKSKPDFRQTLHAMFRIYTYDSALRKILIPLFGVGMAVLLAWCVPLKPIPTGISASIESGATESDQDESEALEDEAIPSDLARQNDIDKDTIEKPKPTIQGVMPEKKSTEAVLKPSHSAPVAEPINASVNEVMPSVAPHVAPTSVPEPPPVAQKVQLPKKVEPSTPQEPESSTTGSLKVSVKVGTTLWFIDQFTQVRIGPYRVDAGKTREIILTKGVYIIDIQQNGRRRQTTISLLGNHGSLDL